MTKIKNEKNDPIQSGISGDLGEYIAAALISEVANVNPYKKDVGLDFECELKDDYAKTFYIQAKGTEHPYYVKEEYILSESIECSKVKNYWLKKYYPVFVFITDLNTRKTYYIRVIDKVTFIPNLTQQTYQFQIPLKNEVTPDNIGSIFVNEVTENQPNITEKDIKTFLDKHYKKYPYLYLNLKELEKLLEVMRGSDQTAQLEARQRIRQMYEKGEIKSTRNNALKKELLQILRNCKDRITQYHVLETLILLNATEVINEIPLQIERNILTFDYSQTPEQMKHVFTGFLFEGLIKLHAANCYSKIRHFLTYKNIFLTRGVIHVAGALKIKAALKDITEHLDDPRFEVRDDAVQALTNIKDKLKPKLFASSIEKPRSDEFLASTIHLLGNLKITTLKKEVIKHINHKNRNVRKQVAYYIGEMNATEFAKDIFNLLLDEDFEVRNEAMSVIVNKLSISNDEKIKFTESILEKTYTDRKIQQFTYLLGILTRFGVKKSLPFLITIYKKEPNKTINIRWDDPEKGIHTQPINIKVSLLELLKKNNITDIEADIVGELKTAPDDSLGNFINIVGEQKLQSAFPVLIELLEKGNEMWRNSIASAMRQINKIETKEWVKETLKKKPTYDLSISCFESASDLKNDPEVVSLIKKQVEILYGDIQNHSKRRLFNYIEYYNVVEVEKSILKDIYTPGMDDLFFVRLSTLIKLSPKGHRDLLITFLPQVEDDWKRFIIEWLGNIKDGESIKAIAEYKNYPSIDIREAVKRVLK